MRICSRCLLPETFPGVDLDGAGVCSFCRHAAGKEARHEEDKGRYAAKFAELLAQVNRPEERGRRSYDVLMAYSGGKDSTYTLALLRRKHGLRVLALSLDNGFVSPRAVENIDSVVAALGVDHVFFRPRWDLLRRIFAVAAERELYPKKTLERASTICTSCIGIVKSVCLKTAIEQRIPLVGFGWSPGQAPVQSSIMKTNPALARLTQQSVLGPLRGVAGDEVASWFLHEEHFADAARFPTNVHPLAWEPYDEAAIVAEIGKLGWRAPDDTDPNSTNCLLNAFANQVHVARYGFHPYIWEIANMVREGTMGREEGLEKFRPVDLGAGISDVRRKLGIDG